MPARIFFAAHEQRGHKSAPCWTPAAESTENAANITTVKEYKFQPASTLPPVKGVSGYKPLADNTVRFAINVWAGWAPLILANNGFEAGQAWKAGDGKEFKVELTLIDANVCVHGAPGLDRHSVADESREHRHDVLGHRMRSLRLGRWKNHDLCDEVVDADRAEVAAAVRSDKGEGAQARERCTRSAAFTPLHRPEHLGVWEFSDVLRVTKTQTA